MNKRTTILLCAAFVLAAPGAVTAQENRQWKEQETWYQFTDKESTHGFKNPRATQPHAVPAAPSVNAPMPPQAAPDRQASDNGALSVPYLLQPGPEPPPPARNIVVESVEPVLSPNAFAAPYWTGIGPYYNWGGHNVPGVWSGIRSNWGLPTYSGGLPMPPGVFPGAPAMTFQPSRRVIQTGPSKASGNYFNPSTPDPTASGSYYAPSGNTPRALPVYQPEAQPKDYWGPQGNPMPPESQPD
jgi:hypothetical protein